MGSVNRLVDLEPGALKQAKCDHNATDHQWMIFVHQRSVGTIVGKISKLLFEKEKYGRRRPPRIRRHVRMGDSSATSAGRSAEQNRRE
jgi:hypothetical protein